MKKIPFHFLIANIFISLWTLDLKARPHAETDSDTVIVRLKNKNKVMIITEKSRDLRSFKTIDINRIVADIDSTFRADSLRSAGNLLTIQTGEKDSVLVIRRVAGGTKGNVYKAVVEITDKQDTIQRHVRRYRGPHINLGGDEDDDLFEIDLGWNNYLEDGQLPGDKNLAYGLTPFNSNVVTLRYAKKIFGKDPKALFSLRTGFEFSWNNYKYDNNVIIRKGSEGAVFDPFPADQKKIKSKLTASWLNVPLMLHYRSPKSTFHAAVGGFAGYRLRSHSKIKYSKDGVEKKDKEYTNFYLNSFQYGLRVQVGFYNVDLFATYNLNTLFTKGKGPELTPIAFGFTL